MNSSQILLMIALSALFWLFYRGVLSRQKTLKFNRYFLLFAVIISLFVPFVQLSLSIPHPLVPVGGLSTYQFEPLHITLGKESSLFSWLQITFLMYWVGVGLLLTRFVFNLSKIILKILRNPHQKEGVHTFILQEESQPYCFLHYIFVPKTEFLQGRLPTEIIAHEKAHVKQGHSRDIVLMELILVFGWFNPFLWLLRKAIALNHEFLADEAVLQNTQNAKQYKALILEKIMQPYHNQFAHQFNFLITKKRFIMMSQNTSKKKAHWLKLGGSFALALFLLIGLSLNAKTQHFPQELSAFSKNLDAQPTPKALGDTLAPPPPPEPLKLKASKIKKNGETIPPPPPPTSVSDTIPPAFPGGERALRLAFQRNFDPYTVKKAKGVLKATISCALSETGKVLDVKVIGEHTQFNQAIKKAFVKAISNTTWIPQKVNGVATKSYFKMPVTMKFQL